MALIPLLSDSLDVPLLLGLAVSLGNFLYGCRMAVAATQAMSSRIRIWEETETVPLTN